MYSKISTLINPFVNFFSKGKERSIKAKKNILASIFIRGISIGISLALVPLTINYINPSRYGVWLTLSSIVAWFSFFDVGLTQGLRNKFAQAKAKEENELAQIYVSTAYAILAVIFATVWLIFLFVNQFLNWSEILNISPELQSEVSVLALIVFTYFCLQFVFKIITTIVVADQQPAKASLIDLLGQALSLILIFILVLTSEGSLIKLGLALCISPLIILIIANLVLFKGIYNQYRPKYSKVRLSHAKELFNLGIIFFVIQVAAIIQYQTANFIIARNFGTADVTNYNIVYKYFGMLNMVFVIFITPFWSASTEAYFKKDILWIKNAIKKYNILTILLLIVGIIMLLFANRIYDLWLGKDVVNIEFSVSLWALVYFVITMIAGTYVHFLNGINALRIQFISSLISPLIYIAFSMLLIHHFHLGIYSLFIASIVANFNGFFLAPLQYHMIVNKGKQGIWVR